MKKCFKCGVLKELTDFYKHKMMGDGHLNKCKDCTKSDVKERYDVLLETDPSFRTDERLRGRQKYHRLYKGQKKDYSRSGVGTHSYRSNYPEKYAATMAAYPIPCPPGSHRHHWSYNEEHRKDVIILSEQMHTRLHRFITYDPKEMKYRTTENTLLETREMHEQYIKIIQEIF